MPTKKEKSEELDAIVFLNTKPSQLSLAAHAIEVGITEGDKLPLMFDYEQTDKDNRTKKNLVSFVVYRTRQGLIVERVEGDIRQKYLEEIKL